MTPRSSAESPNPLTVPAGIPLLESEQGVVEGELDSPESNEILIITGQSGAGRSTAANALEDLDWYVVDNLPPSLLPHLAGMMSPVGGGIHRLAVVVDARGREFFSDLNEVLDDLSAAGTRHRMVFLEADDVELVRRFESSRRPHPLQGDGTILDGLTNERELLDPLRKRADEVIDTSRMSVHDLSRHMRNVVAKEGQRPVQLIIESFGFKHGLPMDADHVVDVRFLENPYWVGELRHLTGRDEAVAQYVLEQEGAAEFAQNYADLLDSVVDGYRRELKPFVTIAVGCTGGRHRSVAIAERVAEILRERGNPVQVLHRDIRRK